MNNWLIEYNPKDGKLVPIYVSVTTKNHYDKIDNSIISLWNNSPSSMTQALSKNPFRFYLVYHLGSDYSVQYRKAKPQYDYAQCFLKHPKETTLPIIHFSIKNILEGEMAHRWKKIVDSSIWNQYVYENDNILADIRTIIQKISTYYDEKRYSLGLAHEYCDFHARLVEQSFLYDGSPHGYISPFIFHSEKEMYEKINEFDNSQKELHNVTLQTIRKCCWRFLLIDDKAIEPMRGTGSQKIPICKLQIIAHDLNKVLGFDKDDKGNNIGKGNSKIWFRTFDFSSFTFDTLDRDKFGNILSFSIEDANGRKIEAQPNYDGGRVIKCEIVNDKFNFVSETPVNPDDIQIVIDCVKSVDEAQYCLRTYKYEIVLLDYLLDINSKREQEFGYHLLEDLRGWHKDKINHQRRGMPDTILDDLYVPGPHNRFFFMFISAFTTAVQERMLEQGFDRSEPGLWFIGDGACPTNTPYLFSYQLLLRMEHRLNDLRREYQGGFITVIDVLKHIYMDKNVRQNAHDHFNHLLYMRNKYYQLEKDLSFEDEKDLNGDKKNDGDYLMNMKSSLLVYSVFKVVHLFSGAFFEHLQHLVYLTAFGTIRQWEELWEEYVFVHNELESYDDIIGNGCKDGSNISRAIREYIINIKENTY